MKDTMILSKNVMLYYLMNELGNVNLEVTTVLDENGSWTGKVLLKQTNAASIDDVKYLSGIQKMLQE